MKIKHLLLATIVLVASITSCTDDKKYTYESDSLKFNSTVAGQSPMSRAANSAWDVGDAIGVFMKQGAGLGTIVDGAANKKYTTATVLGTEFLPADPITQAIYYPASGTVDFIAYYPYVATFTNNYIYKVDVKSQVSQEKIDLLYSNDATGKQSGDQVTLGFKHELTKVVFNLIATTPSVDLTDVVVTIDGMPLTADFDLATGALTVTGTPGIVTLKSTVDAANKLIGLSEGIVIPTAKATRKFSFTFKNAGVVSTYTWDASNEPFDKGKKNTYNVQLGGTQGVLVTPKSTIEDWGPGSSEDIIIDLDGNTTTGNGTQANPYTVADAAKKVGTANTWVTGFIVGSSSKTKAVGTPSKDNIVLAAVAGETDESKWIIVDLIGSPVAANLDIVANPELVGKQVKVQGNIVNDIFGAVLSMTTITAQEGGKDGETPEPSANLLFPGSDFNDWAAFLGGLTEHGVKAYATQSANGRTGSAMLISGSPAGNDYVFTSNLSSAITSNPTAITFYIKGTAAKSLSLNVYLDELDAKGNPAFSAYNLEDCTADKVLSVVASNQYVGVVDTGGKWVKVTLNIAGLNLQKNAGKTIFALKVGKTAAYDLLVDDITYE